MTDTQKQDFIEYTLTENKDFVPLRYTDIPVDFILENVPGVEICGNILKLPLPFQMTGVEEQYREWASKPTKAREKNRLKKYPIDSNKVIFQETAVYASFLNERIPGCVLTDEILWIPEWADTTNIIDQYNIFLKEQEEKHDKWLDECKKQRLGRESSEAKTVESILEEREETHGKFCDHAYYTQSIKYLMHEAPNWVYLDCSKKESLEMIAHKIGRILAGDPNLPDHWDDIAGYATLISLELAEQMKIANSMYPGREGKDK